MMKVEEAVEELRTFGDLVRWGASRFHHAELVFGHGTDNALDESYNLARHALGLPHEIPPYMINCRLTQSERRKIVDLFRQRIDTRKPAAYLINEAWFAGLDFFIDERVIVPRSPIAELIEAHFEPWSNADKVDRILDLCTGSGCIAIACAVAFPHALVEATDISTKALEVAQINVERYALQEQVHLNQSDVFDNIDANQQFDIIVSNPPYVNSDEMEALTEEFKHEPALALQAGEDGLDIAVRILSEVNQYLAPDGILVLEVGNSFPALIENFPDIPFIWPEFSGGGHGVCVLTKQSLEGM